MSFFQGYETDEPCFFKANSNPRVYRTADIVLPTEFLCAVICDFGEARPLGSSVHYNEPHSSRYHIARLKSYSVAFVPALTHSISGTWA